LSRIYCKHDKSRTEYDILKKRIGEKNVMPWIESDVDADKGYIEYRKQDVIWRFEEFLKTLVYKHQSLFSKNLNYSKYRDPPEIINWFNGTDTVSLLIDSLNQFFSELIRLKLFVIQQHSNNEEWETFFQKQTGFIRNTVRLYCSEKTTVEKDISKFEVHTVFKNHKENKTSCAKIDALVTKWAFPRFTDNFINDLSKEFNNSFSVKTAEAADLIINSIDSWYVENHINIPSKEISLADNSASVITDKKYFVYDEIVEDE
jgi:hypothetical protein